MLHSHFVLVVLLAAVIAGPVSAAAPKVRVTTYVYKTVGNLKIKADLHRPDNDRILPVVVWIHGGALINGHRAGGSGRMKTGLLDAGDAIFPLEYRLPPDTKLP